MDSMNEFLKPEIVWFLIGLLLLVLEFIIPGLIISFFGVGAIIVALICILADISVNAQLLIFIVSSVLMLLLLRKWFTNLFMGWSKSKQAPDRDVDDFIGHRALVIKPIEQNLKGKVEFKGTRWDAVSDQSIPEGAPVQIISKDSITLNVKPIETEEEE